MLIGGFVSTVCLKSSKRARRLKMAYFAHKGSICRDCGENPLPGVASKMTRGVRLGKHQNLQPETRKFKCDMAFGLA